MITHKDWNNRSGTVPVSWSCSDYTDIDWISLPPLRDAETTKGFRAYAGAHETYGERISGWSPAFQQAGVGTQMPLSLSQVFDPVRDLFHLDKMIYTFGRYTPGQILPWHQDLYPTYTRRNNVSDPAEVVRVIVFLHDPAPGHQLWIEDRLCTGPAGSWFSWQGPTRHMAANLGETDRYMMQITGVAV